MNNENNAIHTENENKTEDSALKAKIDEIVVITDDGNTIDVG